MKLRRPSTGIILLPGGGLGNSTPISSATTPRLPLSVIM